jgi:small subunit ribosomal protein S7
MSRRHRAEKREVLPDAKFGSIIVTKFMNCVMLDGKKSVAEHIVYAAFDYLAKQTNKDPIEAFEEALENVKPRIEVRSRRVGGATYQIPTEVRGERQQALALRWIVDAARKRNENTMTESLGKELVEANNNRGSAVKKREDGQKMAEANKAFAHYRW